VDAKGKRRDRNVTLDHLAKLCRKRDVFGTTSANCQENRIVQDPQMSFQHFRLGEITPIHQHIQQTAPQPQGMFVFSVSHCRR